MSNVGIINRKRPFLPPRRACLSLINRVPTSLNVRPCSFTTKLKLWAIRFRTSDPLSEFHKSEVHVLARITMSARLCETEETIRITESEGLGEMKKREIKSLG